MKEIQKNKRKRKRAQKTVSIATLNSNIKILVTERISPLVPPIQTITNSGFPTHQTVFLENEFCDFFTSAKTLGGSDNRRLSCGTDFHSLNSIIQQVNIVRPKLLQVFLFYGRFISDSDYLQTGAVTYTEVPFDPLVFALKKNQQLVL